MKILTFCLILAVSVLFFGCASKNLQNQKAINFTAISPLIKINDAGFLQNNAKTSEIKLYKSGVLVLEMAVKDGKVCLNSACENEIKFNEKFFKTTHYVGILREILNYKPIYNAKNLIKNECGFLQEINFIKYEVCGENASFIDSKNGIKIKLKELN